MSKRPLLKYRLDLIFVKILKDVQSRVCPGTKSLSPEKNKKQEKDVVKTGKGRSKTGKEVLKQEKFVLKQEKII